MAIRIVADVLIPGRGEPVRVGLPPNGISAAVNLERPVLQCYRTFVRGSVDRARSRQGAHSGSATLGDAALSALWGGRVWAPHTS